ncbi:MAG TPA: hypothetical protein DCE42_22685 [Myxococcales bacterium]|nr:hypothetical protein [Deltaproteobacteria bacterium]HAA57591.1 hypothetical protein [Myxococcales bacterium]|tara:strand:+ start:3269 stop:4879 length:1611 start_codon:yes stop_codon:yes gene_type:complete
MKEDLLPQSWSTAKISEICEVNPKHSKELDDNLQVSFIPMSSVDDISGTIAVNEERALGSVRKGYTHFADGDVIFAKITPCMQNGKSAVAMGLKSGLACGSTEFYVMRSQGAIQPEYLHRFVRQVSFRSRAQAAMTGVVGLARVPKTYLESVELPIPPLNEQKRIVSKIKALQGHSGRAREALEAVGPLLEKFRQSVLASAFRGDLTKEWRQNNPDVEPAEVLLSRIREERRTRWIEAAAEKGRARAEAKAVKANKAWTPADNEKVLAKEFAKAEKKYTEPEPPDISGLPELPEGWCWVSLEQLGIHRSGVSFKSKDFVQDGVQVIRLGNLYQGKFDLCRDPVFMPEGHPEVGKGLLAKGDLVISQTGTRHKRDYGYFVIIPEHDSPLALNQRLLAVSLVSSIAPEWVKYASRLDIYRNHFFSYETGGVNQGNVGIDGVMKGPIPLAPLDESIVLMTKINNALKSITTFSGMRGQKVRLLGKFDQSTLAKAFRGELVPQDPNDEPASVLLERIKAEREAAKPKKKKKATRRKKAKT